MPLVNDKQFADNVIIKVKKKLPTERKRKKKKWKTKTKRKRRKEKGIEKEFWKHQLPSSTTTCLLIVAVWRSCHSSKYTAKANACDKFSLSNRWSIQGMAKLNTPLNHHFSDLLIITLLGGWWRTITILLHCVASVHHPIFIQTNQHRHT